MQTWRKLHTALCSGVQGNDTVEMATGLWGSGPVAHVAARQYGVRRRRDSRVESAEWQRLARETQALPTAQRISDADIAEEVAAHRARQ